MKANHAFFKKGKGKYGIGNTSVSKENIVLIKHEERLSKYVNDIGFLSRNDIIPPTTELIDVSADNINGTLDFLCTAKNFPAGNKWWEANPKKITIDNGDALPRIDLIVANVPSNPLQLGTISKIKGDPSVNPYPKDIDFSKQFIIKWVYVDALATEPSGFIDEMVWNENVGEPTEFVFSTNKPSDIQVVPNNAEQGTYAIEFINISSFNTARFTNVETIYSGDINLFRLGLKLKAKYKPSASIVVYFKQGSSNTVRSLFIKKDQYGFDVNNLNYQTIKFSTDIFDQQFNFNQIWIQFTDNGHPGCYIDVLSFQEQSTVQPPQENNCCETLQKTITDATYTIKNTDDKFTIFFNRATAITVTIDEVTNPNFTCDFYNLGIGTVTFLQGTANLGTPDGTILETDKVGALIKVLNTNNYKLKGELV